MLTSATATGSERTPWHATRTTFARANRIQWVSCRRLLSWVLPRSAA